MIFHICKVINMYLYINEKNKSLYSKRQLILPQICRLSDLVIKTNINFHIEQN